MSTLPEPDTLLADGERSCPMCHKPMKRWERMCPRFGCYHILLPDQLLPEALTRTSRKEARRQFEVMKTRQMERQGREAEPDATEVRAARHDSSAETPPEASGPPEQSRPSSSRNRPCPSCGRLMPKVDPVCLRIGCGYRLEPFELTPEAVARIADRKRSLKRVVQIVGIPLMVVVGVVTLINIGTGGALSPGKAGSQCASAWDGAYGPLVRATRALMLEPSSFEHMSTTFTQLAGSDFYRVTMHYKGRNGFGGMTTGTASALITQGCRMLGEVAD